MGVEKDGEKKWVDRVRNEDVLRRVNESRTLLRTIQKRKSVWMGHVIRGNDLLTTVIEGTVEGQRRRGRKRHKLMDDVKGERYEDMKNMARNRSKWRRQWRQGPANRQNTT